LTDLYNNILIQHNGTILKTRRRWKICFPHTPSIRPTNLGSVKLWSFIMWGSVLSWSMESDLWKLVYGKWSM